MPHVLRNAIRDRLRASRQRLRLGRRALLDIELGDEQPAFERTVEQHVAFARAQTERARERRIGRDDRRTPAAKLGPHAPAERSIERDELGRLAEPLAVRRIADHEPGHRRFGRLVQVRNLLPRELDETRDARALRVAFRLVEYARIGVVAEEQRA